MAEEKENSGLLKTSSEKLENAMSHVHCVSELNTLALQENMKEIIKCENSIKAIQLQAKKELYKAFQRTQKGESILDSDQLKEEESQLREEVDQLHKALLKHKVFKNTLQDSVFQTQVQSTFHRCLKEVNEDGLKPEVRSTLEFYIENMTVSSQMAKEFNETTQLETENLHSRLKYRLLLQSLEEKWKTLSQLQGQGSVHNYPSDNPELKKLEGKVTKRQQRLELLILLLQSLISSSGERWGADMRLMEIMLLCDTASRQIEGNEEVTEAIQRLKLAKAGEKSTRTREAFVSSTPN